MEEDGLRCNRGVGKLDGIRSLWTRGGVDVLLLGYGTIVFLAIEWHVLCVRIMCIV